MPLIYFTFQVLSIFLSNFAASHQPALAFFASFSSLSPFLTKKYLNFYRLRSLISHCHFTLNSFASQLVSIFITPINNLNFFYDGLSFFALTAANSLAVSNKFIKNHFSY